MPHVPDTVPGKRVTDAGARGDDRSQGPGFRKIAPSGARMAEPRQLLSLIRQQFPGRAPGADYVTEGCPKHVSNFDTAGGGVPVPTAGCVRLRSSIDAATSRLTRRYAISRTRFSELIADLFNGLI